ncbi:hypothetical protein NEISICOT_01511 [Neisseria sicca ATCC 29256]|uniref:Uncharacterized protein n=2 Tax=Neisseria sicca TaxID=490 RepID=I2NVU1_NEISI|nr:hypothetical protein NEISICOT_01511 [Neisseria sicca ATCC 29256]EIG29952.1 hypothetical protein HMPREF1051_0640 [Neisseria sicca VK64]
MIFRIADEYKNSRQLIFLLYRWLFRPSLFSGRKTCLWARPQKYFTHLIFEEFQ